jgi:hypothetical protein
MACLCKRPLPPRPIGRPQSRRPVFALRTHALADASESSNVVSANGEETQHNQGEARVTDVSTPKPQGVLRSPDRGPVEASTRNLGERIESL